MEQVLVNLTVNARDAMPLGGKITIGTANVTLAEDGETGTPLRAGDYVLLTVTDTGTGMDKETQKRIFEPFFTTKEPGKGTGLGLATVYGIVEQCEGGISLQSEVGRGTTFEVYLPRATGTEMPEQPTRRTIRPKAASATILLVEDDAAVRQVTMRILKAQGYTVLEAGGASEARALVSEHGPRIDLLLTDVVMPEVSGVKLAEELAALHPSMRVLYMSGYSGTAVSNHGELKANATYLEKPFTSSTLSERVRDALEIEP
jgi:CheY-like chemotaxis protein